MTTIATHIKEFLENPTRPRDNYLNMKIHFDEGTDARKFRASDAGRCHLYQYWKRQGKKQASPNINNLKMMEMGNLIHAWLDYALDTMGVIYNAEVVVEDEHIKGHIDALVSVNSHVAVYEFKTISGKQAWYMLNNGTKAKREHQYQVLTYLDMMQPKTGDYAVSVLPKEARIAYITREEVNGTNGDKYPPLTIIADVAADLDLLPVIRQDWQTLIDAWEQSVFHGESITPEPNPQHWECKYCPYFADCEQSPFLG